MGRILLSLVLLFGPPAFAGPILVLDPDTPARTDLRTAVGVLRDDTGVREAAALAADPAAFQPLPPGRGLNLGYSRDVVWLRLELRSALPESSDWRLELDYASLDHAELHDGARPVQRAGDRLPFAERATAHRNPVFAIRLEPGETRVLLLRAWSEGSLTLNPLLWRADAFAQHSANAYAAHALYFGMLLALAAYNLLLFVALRDRLYLYYVVFVAAVGVGIASIYGLAGQYLWPDAVDWGNRALVVAFALAGAVGPLFTRGFLGTARHAPGWHRTLAAVAWLNAAVLLVGLLAPLRVGMQAMSVSTLLNCILTLACGIACMLRGLPGARLFVLAWAAILVGGALMALRNFGLLPTHFITLHGMQVGSALEMLLLSFALADRFSALERDKARAQADALAAQEALLDSLKRHERELEERVAERTGALAAANARLGELARTDPLTGLANRTALYERLAMLRPDPAAAAHLLLLDLDGFKAVNDRRGHAAGDRVLVEVATRLRAQLQPGDLAARLGGDEFVLLLESARSRDDVHPRAAAILDAVAGVPTGDAPIGGSIGIAPADPAAGDPDAWLRRADLAMYGAKAAGRGTIRWADRGAATGNAGVA